MSNNCGNCGQPVLDTDTVCWHCGQALTATAVAKPAKPVNIMAAAEAEETLPFTAVAVYGTLTAVLIIAMLLVMHSLGQKPLVLVNPRTQARGEWLPVTAYDQQFTVDLPVEWVWLEADDPQFASLIASSDWWETAVYPLAAIAADADYRFVAMPDEIDTPTDGFVVVMYSRRLGAVTAVQSIALVEQSDTLVAQSGTNFEIVDAGTETSFTGTEVARFLLVLPDAVGERLRCRQEFAPASNGSYVIAACAPEAKFGEFAPIFMDTVASFQPLRAHNP
ncbi:MAG: hypothetical protein R3E31_18540 [Chloroflexota bacterium]|nr:hypothetical protein [Ardenticatenaceae bacterium]